MTTGQALAVAIMAAGKGKRMNNPDIAKVMFPVHGRPMLDSVLDLAEKLSAKPILVIIGWQRETVAAHVAENYPNVYCVEQPEQLGTGHAVQQTEKALANFHGDVLVLSGDVPMLSYETTSNLISVHRSTDAAATILTAELDNPYGYGRIVRSADGSVQKIVEEKDASPDERKINEINSGIYVFQREKLFASLRLLTPNNAQGEYYLTDVFANFRKNEWRISAVKAIDPVEVMGINTVQQLEMVEALIKAKR